MMIKRVLGTSFIDLINMFLILPGEEKKFAEAWFAEGIKVSLKRVKRTARLKNLEERIGN